MTFSDNDSKQFLSVNIDDFCKKIIDKNLQHVLSFGIGILYEGMENSDKEIVEELFQA